nr:hypothetical protein [Candidatus Anoxychlamydiales bacterium]
IQIWFRQNKFVKMLDDAGIGAGTKSVNDDFSLSGLNASLKIQF